MSAGAALDQVERERREPEQAPLLTFDEAPDAPRGPGRPPGAKNRKTQELVDYLQSQGHKPPLQVIAELWRDVTRADRGQLQVMAERLGIKRGELVKMAFGGIEASLPYWHSKQPLAVKGESLAAIFHFGIQMEDDPNADAESGDFAQVDLDPQTPAKSKA